MAGTWDIQWVGTYEANIMGFVSDELQLNKHAEYRDYVCIVDNHIGMVITRWKGSKTLQTVSTIMESGKTDITQCVWQEIIIVKFPLP
eukprot:12481023-Ditylum_brightwellii.AAC.1